MTNPVVLDITILLAIGIAVIRGWTHRSIREFFSLLGLLAGLLLAPLVVGPLANAISLFSDMDVNLARSIALGLALGLPALTGAIFGVRTSRAVTPRGPSRFDALGGAMFALIRSIVVAALILYAVATIAADTNDRDGFAAAIDDSAGGQLLVSADSPFTMLYDGIVRRSDEMQALVLWAKQRSGFEEDVPGGRVAFAATTDKLDTAKDAEREMWRLLNRERTDREVQALEWCEECARVARSHSKDMYRNGYFSHIDSDGDDPFDRMMAADIAYGAAGENLSIAPTVTKAHDGLMESPDHRENILRTLFDEVGIGCYEGPYGFMCTQVFRALL
jgi:uncharacterized protein YkwD/uncharacterized membrane protein required for colicin V production